MSGPSREALQQALDRLTAVERYREGLRQGIPACGAAIALVESALATPETDAVAALRAENDRLRQALMPRPAEFPARWRLSHQQATVLSVILAAAPDVATADRIRAALYQGRSAPASAERVPAVLVSAVRTRLARVGIEVRIWNVLSTGFRMTVEDRDRLRTLAEEAA